MALNTLETRALNLIISACRKYIGDDMGAVWEQRRYEIAKDFATRMYAASCYTGSKTDAIKAGVKFSDELIEALQKGGGDGT